MKRPKRIWAVLTGDGKLVDAYATRSEANRRREDERVERADEGPYRIRSYTPEPRPNTNASEA